jgi:fructose-1,6-bisphosphatase/inositol monophosphatase family enzyme
MMVELHDPVVALMRQVGRDIVMPRYQNLAAEEISEKAANDFVTIADKESEIRLAEGLASILPEAGVIGEEACAADPSILDRAGDGLNWIIDPIDGTGNFASGKPPFGIMIALADNGATLAGWILDPLTGRLCHATMGGGSHVDGERIWRRKVAAICRLLPFPPSSWRRRNGPRWSASRRPFSPWWTFPAAPPSNIPGWCWGRMTCRSSRASCRGIMRPAPYSSMRRGAAANGSTAAPIGSVNSVGA